MGVFLKPESSVTKSSFNSGTNSNVIIEFSPGRAFFTSQPSVFSLSSNMECDVSKTYDMKKYLESNRLYGFYSFSI